MKKIYILFLIVTLISCSKKEEDIKLIPIKSGDKWGYIDKEGKYIINAQFEEAHLFRDGIALVKSSENKFGYIGEDGKYIINPIYKSANSFSENMACVVMENGKPQFIDNKGKIVFTMDADACGGFSEGMAPVKVNGKWGYIDKTGKIIINPAYESANKFSEGLAAVEKIDEKTKDKKWGFIDKDGGIKIDFQFKEDTATFCSPSYFSEGLAFVSSDGKKWGCINKEGKYEINPQFDGGLNFNYEYKRIYEFKNGIAAVKQGDNWGYIDKTGKYIINPQFISVQDFNSDGKAAVQSSDKKYGFIDKEGKYIINPQFDNVKLGYLGGFAIVKSSDKYGIINEKGTYIVNPQFDGVWICTTCWENLVESDFIDNESLAKNFFQNSNEAQIRNTSISTTLKDIIDLYPNTSSDNLKMYTLVVEKPNLTINDVLKVVDVKYYFSNNTFTDVPVYKDVQKYSYWAGGYVNDKQFDHYDKKYNTDAKVDAVSFSMGLVRSGAGKSAKLALELKNIAVKKLSMQLMSHPETNNNDEKGLFILKSENLLMEIKYYSIISDDKKTTTPYLIVTFINKNYFISNSDNYSTFEELEQSFVKSFTKENNKDKS